MATKSMNMQQVLLCQWGNMWDDVFECLRLAVVDCFFLDIAVSGHLYHMPTNITWFYDISNHQLEKITDTPQGDKAEKFNAHRERISHPPVNRVGPDWLAGHGGFRLRFPVGDSVTTRNLADQSRSVLEGLININATGSFEDIVDGGLDSGETSDGGATTSDESGDNNYTTS